MIYFDAGATTLQKPETVARAMYRAVGQLSSPGRGSYPATRAAEETDLQCRTLAAKLFGVTDPARVVFTSCATHGLNIAVHTLVKPGGRVICTHVSNVFGFRLPVERIAALCREKGVPFVLDASQSAGMLPVDMDALGAAFIAMPGHKGLYGPQGTGLLLCGAEPEPLLRGGTGSQSILQEMPEELPDRLEAGTHNMPGIAGLLEGLRFVEQQGVGRIAGHERHLTRQMAARLRDIPGAEVFYTPEDGAQTGVLSFRLDGWDCEALGEALAAQGAAVRAGLHCAPLAHRTAGTLETGTVRCSFSAFSTTAQVEHFAHILRQIVR